MTMQDPKTLVERVARAMEPRTWQAFDGYIETFGGVIKDYTREQQWEAFIYGSPLVKGHDWGKDLDRSLNYARAAIAATEIEHLQSQLNALAGLVEESLFHLRLDERAELYHNKALAALKTVGSMDR